MLERSGGLDTIPELHRRLRQVIDRRPATRIVTPLLDDIDQTYRNLLDHI